MKKTVLSILATVAINLVAQVTGDVTTVINGKTYVQHTVTQGETLYGLSKKFASTVDEIKSVNDDITIVKIGQVIWVPSSATETANTSNLSSTASSATNIHVVESGETLYSISKKFNVSAEDIKKWNNLNDNSIIAGQALKINAASTAVAAAEKTVAEKTPASTATSTSTTTTAKVTSTNTSSKSKPAVNNTADVSETSVQATSSVTVKRQDESSESMTAFISSADDMTADRCYVKHPTIPVGNIIVVINPANGKMAYCRVVENNADNSKLELTKAVAEKLSLSDTKSTVTIKYATL